MIPIALSFPKPPTLFNQSIRRIAIIPNELAPSKIQKEFISPDIKKFIKHSIHSHLHAGFASI